MYFVVDANGFQVYYWSAFTAESEIQGEKVVAECATLELRLSGVGYDLISYTTHAARNKLKCRRQGVALD
jgi:hypothetical protein